MFDVSADAYGRFMGRFSEPLARELMDLLEPRPPARALDVGCGPGAVTSLLVDRLGVADVAAVDPSASFLAALRRRFPELDARRASAEQLPFDDRGFDLVVAQLVVHFMEDPVAGLHEMSRVAAPGGRVAASVWDFVGGSGPLELYARAARELDPEAPQESERPGSGPGGLAGLFAAAGMHDTSETVLTVTLRFRTFEEWWEPFTLGVGPAGAYLAGLDELRREALRRRCAELVGPPPFEISGCARCVVASV